MYASALKKDTKKTLGYFGAADEFGLPNGRRVWLADQWQPQEVELGPSADRFAFESRRPTSRLGVRRPAASRLRVVGRLRVWRPSADRFACSVGFDRNMRGSVQRA